VTSTALARSELGGGGELGTALGGVGGAGGSAGPILGGRVGREGTCWPSALGRLGGAGGAGLAATGPLPPLPEAVGPPGVLPLPLPEAVGLLAPERPGVLALATCFGGKLGPIAGGN